MKATENLKNHIEEVAKELRYKWSRSVMDYYVNDFKKKILENLKEVKNENDYNYMVSQIKNGFTWDSDYLEFIQAIQIMDIPDGCHSQMDVADKLFDENIRKEFFIKEI